MACKHAGGHARDRMLQLDVPVPHLSRNSRVVRADDDGIGGDIGTLPTLT